jgi:hypothetical protein
MDLGFDGLGWAGLARPHVITFHANIICQLQCAAQRFNTSGRDMRAHAHTQCTQVNVLILKFTSTVCGTRACQNNRSFPDLNLRTYSDPDLSFATE